MGEPDYDEAQKVLEQANKELQIAFSAFNYYYVSHELWGKISGLIKNDKANQLQFVAQGTSVWSTAARAGKWLGDHGRR